MKNSPEDRAKVLDAHLRDRTLLDVGTREDGYIILNFGEYALFLEDTVSFTLGVGRMPS